MAGANMQDGQTIPIHSDPDVTRSRDQMLIGSVTAAEIINLHPGLSRNTFNSWVRRGLIEPKVRIGPVNLFDQNEATELIQARMKKTRTEDEQDCRANGPTA